MHWWHVWDSFTITHVLKLLFTSAKEPYWLYSVRKNLVSSEILCCPSEQYSFFHCYIPSNIFSIFYLLWWKMNINTSSLYFITNILYHVSSVSLFSISQKIMCSTCMSRGMCWRRWLTHCGTSQKVAGSIPDGVTGIFQWLNPSGRIVALGSTQPLAEMSTRNPSWE
jgi:hypothetical protein